MRKAMLVISLSLVALPLLGQGAPPQGAANQPYTMEYYYKVQWGHQQEFLQLFLKNHYPRLQKNVGSGRILSVKIETPANGSAQVSTVFDPLSTPNGTVLCHSIHVDPTDSAAFLFEYVDGKDSARQRISLVAFDSAGAPLHMMLSAPGERSNGERLTYVFMVQFFPL